MKAFAAMVTLSLLSSFALADSAMYCAPRNGGGSAILQFDESLASGPIRFEAEGSSCELVYQSESEDTIWYRGSHCVMQAGAQEPSEISVRNFKATSSFEVESRYARDPDDCQGSRACNPSTEFSFFYNCSK